MLTEIDLYRKYVLGKFQTLLLKISQDPGMMYWLDNQNSHKDAPNENYGRELLELFSMGIDETKKANDAGAIESLVFSEKAIQDSDEQEIVDFLNDVESKGGEIFSVDSTIDAGLRVSGLGGIISLLRFPLEY